MTRQDDDLVRRYHEASEQEGARPGAHVREVERSAEMIFDATKKYHGLGARERLLLKIACLCFIINRLIKSSKLRQY